MSYFVYILKSKITNWQYIGMSANPYERLNSHNAGKVRSTKSRKPFEIIVIEKFTNRISARYREKYYKTGFGRKVWMKKIQTN